MFKILKIHVFIITLIVAFPSSAQRNIKALGKLYVHNQSSGSGIALHQNRIFGGDQGILSTARDTGEDAQILFSNASSWQGASSLSYVDGFVKSNHDKAFIFPVGSNGHYKPVACSKPKGVTAAYFSNDSSFDVEEFYDGIVLLNKSEYWVVQGTLPTQMTFTWDMSDKITKVTEGDINKLKILGFDGSSWKVLESKIEPFCLDAKNSNKNYLKAPSSLNNGAISTFKEIVPNLYMAYALGVSNGAKIKRPENKIVASRVSNKNRSNTKRRSNKINLSTHIKVGSIHFPFTESKITRYSTHLLQKIAKDLKGGNIKIKLVGHADFYGSHDFNYKLGLARANAVKDMLLKQGLNTVEVDIVSNGESAAIKNECENCHSKETLIDRRVDIYAYKN